MRRLDLIFERIDRRNVALRIGTASATRDARHLARLFDERLQTVDPGFGIEAAVLVASKIEPLSAHQVEAQDFRSGDVTAVDLEPSRRSPRRAARAKARLSASACREPYSRALGEAGSGSLADQRTGMAGCAAAPCASARTSGTGHRHRLAARSSAGFLYLAARASSGDQGRWTGTHHGRMVAGRARMISPCAIITASRTRPARASGCSAMRPPINRRDGGCTEFSHEVCGASGHDALLVPARRIEPRRIVRAGEAVGNRCARHRRSQFAGGHRQSP